MVEQRYQAVREVIDSGDSITEVAARFGVDRRTLHRWLTKYANGGLAALATRSNRPDTCPQDLGLETVAEGVETLSQVELLRENNVGHVQGYLFSRPLDPEAFEVLLFEQHRPVESSTPPLHL